MDSWVRLFNLQVAVFFVAETLYDTGNPDPDRLPDHAVSTARVSNQSPLKLTR